ncbi:MAG: preprotein translocase subunit SecA [Deltaproteobacteria bacterium]|nr:preprotein translocase subunit SecA [Deltaproteobacteria bacterium]
MIGNLLAKVFGTKNEREIDRLGSILSYINSLELSVQALSDDALRGKTAEFKNRLANGESLDDILPEAFAVVRETARRVLGQRHFDMQIMGGIVLHQGKIAEMKTGEGKTLVATLPVYLNALTGRGVHVVTVNDYLARRDAEWMGGIYKFLGLSVGVVVHGLNDAERKQAYFSDITYGTNNEFGFDYLRDNMKFSVDDFVQRDFCYALVDEVDSILIDEARTPLIISGEAEKSTELYYRVAKIIPKFRSEQDYVVEEKTRTVVLTEEGVAKAEKLLKTDNLYDPKNIETLHHVNQALRAHTLFKKDVDYIVKDGEVIIVDEFTGRLMPGRRYSEGLHQALEAKEEVKIESENQTLASVTFQNYFRMYEKLAGMTGTADTEAVEFQKIYKLEVVIIPTNMSMIRTDYPDAIYKTENEKFKAVAREIKELHAKGQPVLVGTISIEKSERLSSLLRKEGIRHSVLNAKHHEKEAEIVSRAGQQGAVTLSTNMAGRGTDIVLGEGVPGLGGLHIVGTERHEARRIDNQLRGRAGRQGDQGSSRFYLSLEDDLLRIFGSERISSIMDKLGMEEDQPIEHTLVSKAIENAQKKVEAQNFEIRKRLLEYDDVMNQQREVIYRQRREILGSDNLQEYIGEMIEDIVSVMADAVADEKSLPEEWDLKGLADRCYGQFSIHLSFAPEEVRKLNRDRLEELVLAQAKEAYAAKERNFGPETLRALERFITLQTVDSLWKDHLLNMDHLKEGIGLRGYGQKDPLQEYKREGYEMFMAMVERIKEGAVSTLFRVQLAGEADLEDYQRPKRQEFSLTRGDEGEGEKEPVRRQAEKIGRNQSCPCGSGKKYKKCCGKK